MLAAEKGLPYTFALFINGEGGEQYTRFYRNQFKPSLYLKKPLNMVTVFAICAETDQEAERLTASMDLSMIMMEQGMESKGIPSPEKAASYSYSPYELERVKENRKRMVIGSPKTVLAKLVEIAEKYETDEIMLASILYDFNDKLTSYELIAKAAGIH
jgi:luciferase family oxidoreductase group 1